MQCPYCHARETEVVETRVGEEGVNIRRRRACGACTKRFTTYERVENILLLVKKKDGARECFSREKLRTGLVRACEKTKISLEEISTIIDAVEKELRCSDSIEIESAYIGYLIAERLKQLDKVAYIRFSSVFRRFVDLEDFEQELKKLVQR